MHDNIIKAFIWYEDDNHSKSYFMIQLGDLGAIGEITQNGGFEVNQKVIDFLEDKFKTDP